MTERLVPEYLRQYGHFCLWKREPRDGQPTKPTKVPYSINGTRARSDDPATFTTWERAFKALEESNGQYAGLGVGLFDDLVGVDIDHCINADGSLSPLAQEVIATLDSYAERSPSGTGIHVLCRALELTYDKRRYLLNNRSLGLEVYVGGHTNRFLTVTGDAINALGVEERTEKVQSLLNKYMARKTPTEPETLPTFREEREDVDPDAAAMDDEETIARALRSKNGDRIRKLLDGDYTGAGYSSQSEGDLSLVGDIAFFCGGDAEQIDRIFRKSGLMRPKWDEPRGSATYGELTIRRALSGMTSFWTPGNVAMDAGVARAVEFLKEIDLLHNRRYTLDDIGAGFLLADYMKPFARPLGRSRVWIAYDGRRWAEDPGGIRAEQTAKDLARALMVFAGMLPRDNGASDADRLFKWAVAWGQRNRRATFIDDAKSVHPVARSDFDRDSWLLNAENGTLDLRTGDLREHRADDLLTRIAPVVYDPTATCPRWDRFIEEVTEPGDDECCGRDRSTVAAEKAQFLRQYLGYALTGDTSRELFCVMYGATSRNGKGVLTSSVQAVLGDYALTMSPETLTQGSRSTKDGRSPSEDIARLNGVRLAVAGEIAQGARLNASLIKQLTGGDRMNARFLGENSFDFQPQCKLLLHTNHLPQTNDLSVFDSHRVAVVVFGRHFEPWEQDPGLKQLFRQPEAQSAILNWMLAGLAEYRRSGLRIPEAVRAASEAYRQDSDKLARFVEERLTPAPSKKTRLTQIYSVYGAWCRENGCYPESSRNFGRALERHNIRTAKCRPTGEVSPTQCVLDYGVAVEYL